MHKVEGKPGQGLTGATTLRRHRLAPTRVALNGRRIALAFVLAVTGVVVVVGTPFVGVRPAAASGSFSVDIPRPAGGFLFGDSVFVLSNGNYVIADPYAGPFTSSLGAVYLFDGKTNQIISTLTGTKGNSVRIFEVGASNFVVFTPVLLDGAITWVNGTTGLNGSISVTNSLTGAQDMSGGYTTVTNLTNGNYVVSSQAWNSSRGYAHWAPGNAPTVGAIGAANSAVGKTVGDRISSTGIVPLANGNYVICSPEFDLDLGPFGIVANAGAATFGNGTTGFSGELTGTNSLVGTTDSDTVGGRVIPLTNGNYVVSSPNWHAGALAVVGAATWAPGTTGIVGSIDATNSLVGTSVGDAVGSEITALSNGHYVVGSYRWSNGAVPLVGAVTWSDGTAGKVGPVNASNSLIGAAANDQVGYSISAASTGNYVVASPFWGPTDVGAATWVNGSAPTVGFVSAANSLIGSTPGDRVGSLTPLPNGNVVVASYSWDSGSVTDAGAVTWMSGSSPTVGVVSASNSVVGSHTTDSVGNVTPLANGDYTISSAFWDNGSITDAGAIRVVSGTGPSTGPITAENSLFGSTAGDEVGRGILSVSGGGFLARTPLWSNGASSHVGAVTLSTGATPTVGAVSSSNSVVGVKALDYFGTDPVFAFDDGSVVAFAPQVGTGAVVAFKRGTVGSVATMHAVLRTPERSQYATETHVAVRRTASGAILVGRPSDRVATLVYAPGPDNVPLAPARLADTRLGSQTTDGLFAGDGVRPAGSTYEVVVVGRGGVPADASAVVLNVTVDVAAGDGFATVYPCGEPLPNASNLNFSTGATVPNAVIAKVGAAGKVCFFVSQATDLIVDVNGFVPLRSSYRALNPARLLDTRPLGGTFDGVGAQAGLRPSGSITAVQVNRGGVAADATAVVLNVTATEATADGFVTVFPCGTELPLASNVNYRAKSSVPNMVIAKIGVSSNVCVYNSAPTQLIVDVNGYLQPDAWYRPLVPSRLLDTRSALATIDGKQSGGGPVAGGSVTVVNVVGRANIANDASAVALNVTVVDPTDAGYATVYPCGTAPPLASNLNFLPGATIPNAVVAKVGLSGDVCVYTSSKTQLIVDVNGYYYN